MGLVGEGEEGKGKDVEHRTMVMDEGGDAG